MGSAGPAGAGMGYWQAEAAQNVERKMGIMLMYDIMHVACCMLQEAARRACMQMLRRLRATAATAGPWRLQHARAAMYSRCTGGEVASTTHCSC